MTGGQPLTIHRTIYYKLCLTLTAIKARHIKTSVEEIFRHYSMQFITFQVLIDENLFRYHKFMFHSFDRDRDGYLNTEEFRELMIAMGQQVEYNDFVAALITT